MEEKKQQFNQAWVMSCNHDSSPQTKRGDIYLAISQDLAQAVTIVESNYYQFLDKDD